MNELALIIKVQAVVRGFLARKNVRTMYYNAGMGSGQYAYNEDGELQQDYDNPKVQEIREHLNDFDYDAETNHGRE